MNRSLPTTRPRSTWVNYNEVFPKRRSALHPTELQARIKFRIAVTRGYTPGVIRNYCFKSLVGDRGAPRVNFMAEKSNVKLSKFTTISWPRFPYRNSFSDPVREV